jgi:hypothetical protein
MLEKVFYTELFLLTFEVIEVVCSTSGVSRSSKFIGHRPAVDHPGTHGVMMASSGVEFTRSPDDTAISL